MSSVSTESLSNKSNFYHIEQSINPIIAAASPIISMLSRLYGSDKNLNEPDSWQAICKHEINVCLERCQKYGYNSEEIEKIRSIIVTWINTNSIWHYNDDTIPYSFETLIQLMDDSEKNFYILELIYILNRLGLVLHESPQINELKIQELYYLIQTKRQIKSHAIQKQENINRWISLKKTHKTKNIQYNIFLISANTMIFLSLWFFWQDITNFYKLILINSQVFY